MIANWLIGIVVHSDVISGAENLSTNLTTNHNKPPALLWLLFSHPASVCFWSFNWESHLAITRSAQEWRTTGSRLPALVHLLQPASGASLGPMALSLPFLEAQRESPGTVFVCCTYRSPLTLDQRRDPLACPRPAPFHREGLPNVLCIMHLKQQRLVGRSCLPWQAQCTHMALPLSCWNFHEHISPGLQTHGWTWHHRAWGENGKAEKHDTQEAPKLKTQPAFIFDKWPRF